DPLRSDEASARARGRGARRHPARRQRKASLPQSGADPRAPRPLDRQVHGASRERAPRPQGTTGGDRMSTSVETEVQTTQVYQLFIKASPERVWEAITKPELIVRYFYGAMFEGPPVAAARWPPWP